MNYDKYILPLLLIIAAIGASFFVPPFVAAMLIPAMIILFSYSGTLESFCFYIWR